MEIFDKYRSELNKVCLTNQVEELYAFGSVLSDQFNENSDIDFIVSILLDDPIEYAEKYFCLLYTSPSPRDKRQSRMPSSA